MKRVLLVTLFVLCGCDWNAAENKARCTAGELSFCADGGPSGDGGGGTGGDGGVDGGTGRIDTVLLPDGNPFSLEEGPGGIVWVIVERNDWTWVAKAEGSTVTPLGAFDAGPSATHADPKFSPALLVATVNGGAGTGYPDGSLGPQITLPAAARVVSQGPVPDAGVTASFWLMSSNTYLQYLSPTPTLLAPQQVLPAATCTNLDFHDLALTDADGGCCAVIGWSGSCNGGIGAGIDGGSGIQIVAADNTRTGIRLENGPTTVRVGKSTQGFDVATKLTTSISFRRYDFGINQIGSHTISPDGGSFLLGDVSDGFVSFNAVGGFVVDTTPASIATQSVMIAEPSTRRIVAIGAARLSRMPILALQNRVYVLWKRDSGQVMLTQIPR